MMCGLGAKDGGRYGDTQSEPSLTHFKDHKQKKKCNVEIRPQVSKPRKNAGSREEAGKTRAQEIGIVGCTSLQLRHANRVCLLRTYLTRVDPCSHLTPFRQEEREYIERAVAAIKGKCQKGMQAISLKKRKKKKRD